MLSESQRRHLSDILQPASSPRQIDNIFTEDQRRRMLDVVANGN